MNFFFFYSLVRSLFLCQVCDEVNYMERVRGGLVYHRAHSAFSGVCAFGCELAKSSRLLMFVVYLMLAARIASEEWLTSRDMGFARRSLRCPTAPLEGAPAAAALHRAPPAVSRRASPLLHRGLGSSG